MENKLNLGEIIEEIQDVILEMRLSQIKRLSKKKLGELIYLLSDVLQIKENIPIRKKIKKDFVL